MTASPFHFTIVGSGPHPGLIKNCEVCKSRAKYRPPVVTLPPTPEECEDEIGRLTEDLDPVSIFTVLITVCDALDMDPMEVMCKIKLDERLAEGSESIIGDCLEQSQSAYPRSVDLLYRAAALHAHKEALEETLMQNQLRGIPNP